jgi:hypothetical protein
MYRLQCCLAWKKIKHEKRGIRMTKEVVDTLTCDGAVNPDHLDKALNEFDLHFSIKKKMIQKNVTVEEGATGLDSSQLAAVIRKTRSIKGQR